MKNLTKLFAIAFLLFLSTQIFSQVNTEKNISSKECCVKSLLQGLKSDNLGLQSGCTYMLGEICCGKSVIALMDVLHNHPSEEVRILAALSLYKIRDSRGIFAIRQEMKFDESERVRRMCEKFYKVYLNEQNENNAEVSLTLKYD
jgi:HEAT repeat protein